MDRGQKKKKELGELLEKERASDLMKQCNEGISAYVGKKKTAGKQRTAIKKREESVGRYDLKTEERSGGRLRGETRGEDNTSEEGHAEREREREREKGERLMSEHAGRGSWCNADGIAMETNGGKAQTRRRGLERKEEITASRHGGWGVF